MRIVVTPETQIAELFDNKNNCIRKYIVSTGKSGLGLDRRSNDTPTGNFKICRKVGDGAPLGTVFVSRKPNGMVWNSDASNPLNQGENKNKGFVMTRILWLRGIDRNNRNTKRRYIYFHGTKFEGKLGTPNSMGCIVMKNEEMVDLYDLVPKGCRVFIQDVPYDEAKAKEAQSEALLWRKSHNY